LARRQKESIPPGPVGFHEGLFDVYGWRIVGFISKLIWNDKLYKSLKTAKKTPPRCNLPFRKRTLGAGQYLKRNPMMKSRFAFPSFLHD
jgi:hypothetical protein